MKSNLDLDVTATCYYLTSQNISTVNNCLYSGLQHNFNINLLLHPSSVTLVDKETLAGRHVPLPDGRIS